MQRGTLIFTFFVLSAFGLFGAGCGGKKTSLEPEVVRQPDTSMGTSEAPTEGDVEVKPLNEGEIFQTIGEKTLSPVYFDYNSYEIRVDQIPVLEQNANVLRQNANARLLIEGHCDERGTQEYNMALGAQRAEVAMEYLVGLGIVAERLQTLSYGEEQPFSSDHTEDAWAKNRRAHFVQQE